MVRLNDIVEKVESYHPAADLDLLRRCYAFAERAHDGQTRRSGEPYLVHPLDTGDHSAFSFAEFQAAGCGKIGHVIGVRDLALGHG